MEFKNERMKDFAEFFGTEIKSVRKMKDWAHCASWISQSFALFFIFQSGLISYFGKVLLGFICFGLAVLLGYVIEKGIATFLPTVTRQIVRRKFVGGHYKTMFVLNLVIVIPLAILSPTLSGEGGKEFVQRLTPLAQQSTGDTISIKYDQQVADLNASHLSQSNQINRTFDNRIAAIERKYDAKIAIHNQERKRLLRLDQEKHRWARGSAAVQGRKALALESTMNEEKGTIESERAAELSNLLAATQMDKKAIDADKNRVLGIFDGNEKTKVNQRESYVGLWGSILKYIFYFSVAAVFFFTFKLEVYRAGAGQDYEKYVDEETPSKWDELWQNVGGRVNIQFDKFVNWVGQEQPEIATNSVSKPTQVKGFRNTKQQQSKQAESTETKGINSISKAETGAKSQTVIVVQDVTKLIKDARNHYGRKTTAATPTARDTNEQKYNAEKAALEANGFRVIEVSDRSLQILPKE